MQRRGDQPGRRAGRLRPVGVGGIAQASRTDETRPRGLGADLGQAGQIGAGPGTDPLQSHEDDGVGPGCRILGQTQRIEGLLSALVQREDGPRQRLQTARIAQRFTGPDRVHAFRGEPGRGQRLAMLHSVRDIDIAGIQPEAQGRMGIEQGSQQDRLTLPPHQGIQVGQVQGVTAGGLQHSGHGLEGIPGGAQRRVEGLVRLSLSTQRMDDAPCLQVDDRDQWQRIAHAWTFHRPGMSSILVYESLSGGGFGPETETADLRELLPQGVAMRDMIVGALCGLPGLEVSVVDSVWAPWAPRNPRSAPADPVHALRLEPGEREAEGVGRLARRHDIVWAVAPESEARLVKLARAIGPQRWAGSDADTLAIAGSKTSACAHLHAYGLPTPLSFTGLSPGDDWVLKPDQGAGAIDTWRLPAAEAHAAAQRWRAEGRTPCLQPWVDGETLSLSLIAREEGIECVAVNRQTLTQAKGGGLHFVGVQPLEAADANARQPAAQALAERLHRALPGLRGLVGVDLVWHPERGPVLIEINARLTLACVGLDTPRRAQLARAHLQACGFTLGAPHAIA